MTEKIDIEVIRSGAAARSAFAGHETVVEGALFDINHEAIDALREGYITARITGTEPAPPMVWICPQCRHDNPLDGDLPETFTCAACGMQGRRLP